MTKPVITETIVADDPTKVTGSIRLYARDGGGGTAYTYGGSSITVGQVIRISFNSSGVLKADDGTTALQLNPNVNTSGSNTDAIVTPTGTVWQYEIRYPGVRTPEVRYLSVPDGAGPYTVAATLTEQPGALAPAGSKAYTDSVALAKAGDTSTGPINFGGTTYPMRVTDVGGSYYLLEVWKGAKTNADHAIFHFRDQSGPLPLTVHKIIQFDDYLGSPIAWLANEGGWKVTDHIEFVGGDLIPRIRMGWLDSSSNTGPALIFGNTGTGGSTVTANSASVTLDAGKDAWIRLLDDNATIHSAMTLRAGTANTTEIGSVSPTLLLPGMKMTNTAGTGSVYVYRSAADTLTLLATTTALTGSLTVAGSVQVADSAAGVPGIKGGTSTTTGPRWDSTLGMVWVVAGTDRWRIGTSGNLVPAADNTYDLGASTAQVKDAYAARIILAGLTDNTAGSAAPEASVTARPGSIYGRSAGTLWLKESGSGNTGWKQVITGSYTIAGDVGGTPDATAIGSGKVTNTHLATAAANTVKANATSGTASPTDVALTASTTLARLSSGNIVAATPQQTTALNAQATFGYPVRNMITGFYAQPGGNTTTAANAANTATAIPFVPNASVTATRLAINVTSNTATSLVRVGIYNDDGTGKPGTVLVDGGQLDTHTATGVVEATISTPLTAGTLYWLVGVAQTAAPTLTCINASDWSIPCGTSSQLSANYTGWGMTGVSSTLPTWSSPIQVLNAIKISVKC